MPSGFNVNFHFHSKSPSTKSLDRIGNGSIVRPSIPPPLPPRKASKEEPALSPSTIKEVRSQSVPPPPPPRKDDLKTTNQQGKPRS